VYNRDATADLDVVDEVALAAVVALLGDVTLAGAALVDVVLAGEDGLEAVALDVLCGDCCVVFGVGCDTARLVTVRRLAIEGAIDGALLLATVLTLGGGDGLPSTPLTAAVPVVLGVEALLEAEAGRTGTVGILLRPEGALLGAGVNRLGPACALLIKAAALRTDVTVPPLAFLIRATADSAFTAPSTFGCNGGRTTLLVLEGNGGRVAVVFAVRGFRADVAELGVSLS